MSSAARPRPDSRRSPADRPRRSPGRRRRKPRASADVALVLVLVAVVTAPANSPATPRRGSSRSGIADEPAVQVVAPRGCSSGSAPAGVALPDQAEVDLAAATGVLVGSRSSAPIDGAGRRGTTASSATVATHPPDARSARAAKAMSAGDHHRRVGSSADRISSNRARSAMRAPDPVDQRRPRRAARRGAATPGCRGCRSRSPFAAIGTGSRVTPSLAEPVEVAAAPADAVPAQPVTTAVARRRRTPRGCAARRARRSPSAAHEPPGDVRRQSRAARLASVGPVSPCGSTRTGTHQAGDRRRDQAPGCCHAPGSARHGPSSNQTAVWVTVDSTE